MLNRAALRALGYARDTPDPPGGEIQRDKAGNSTGLLIAERNAFILYSTLAKSPNMNHVMKELGPISSAAPEFPLATSAMAPLRARAESEGSGDFSPLWSGQNASGCKEVPAARLTRELAAGL
jgi:hypothetical protein